MGVTQATAPFSLTAGSIAYANLDSSLQSYQKIQVLGSGTATITGDGSVQNIGSFSTTGDIGNGVIQLRLLCSSTSGDDTSDLTLDNTSGSGSGLTLAENIVNSKTNVEAWLMKCFKTTTSCGYRSQWTNGDAISGKSDEEHTQFNVSAAETFYLDINPPAATTLKIIWIAYLIED